MRLAILSDIHEDIDSLKKIIGKIEKSGYDHLICLGDIAGFSVPHYTYRKTRNAHECLSLLREKNCMIVPGNHDYHSAQVLPVNSEIFDFPENWYTLDYQQRKELGKNEIWLHEEDNLNPLYTLEDIAYLRSLPEYFTMKHGESNILFSHYVYPNLSGFKKGFYTRPAEFRSHFEFMENHDCNISFTGHAHIRGAYTVSQGQFKHYRYKTFRLKNFPVCIGISPLTRHKNCSGFCNFDLERSILQVIKC